MCPESLSPGHQSRLAQRPHDRENDDDDDGDDDDDETMITTMMTAKTMAIVCLDSADTSESHAVLNIQLHNTARVLYRKNNFAHQ